MSVFYVVKCKELSYADYIVNGALLSQLICTCIDTEHFWSLVWEW